jgi:hypothetical protein
MMNFKILLVFLLLSLTSLSQLVVLKKEYMDKNDLILKSHTTCDTNTTLRVVTDEQISNHISEVFACKFSVNSGKDGVELFCKEIIKDSNLNVLLIRINSGTFDYHVKSIINELYGNKPLLDFLKRAYITRITINYFQVLFKDEQSEVIIVRVMDDESEKVFKIYNKRRNDE